jgi:hypothetical protein
MAGKNNNEDTLLHYSNGSTVVLTFHQDYNIVTCVCGVVIQGEHSCNNEMTRIQVKVCHNLRSEECQICLKKEKEQKFEDQWRTDEDGYSCCSYCGYKCYGELPKICPCSAYVDKDGVEKCKSCNETWENLIDIEMGECDTCGYMGE